MQPQLSPREESSHAPCFPVGARIRFSEEKRSYIVLAANPRYAVCTKPFAVYRPGAVLYTIVDVAEGVRGPENLIFCMGFATDRECLAALERLASGESEVSHRHRVHLSIEAVRPPRAGAGITAGR